MRRTRTLFLSIYHLYVGIGIFAVGLMAFLVIGSVIFRYIFGISSQAVEEFITVVFEFTTFWGVGIAIIEREHIGVSNIVEKFPKTVQHILTFVTQGLSLIVLGVVFYYSLIWVEKASGQLSYGMKVPMNLLYSIVPVCIAIAIICCVSRIVMDYSKISDKTMKE